jgi:hypothetical protein
MVELFYDWKRKSKNDLTFTYVQINIEEIFE